MNPTRKPRPHNPLREMCGCWRTPPGCPALARAPRSAPHRRHSLEVRRTDAIAAHPRSPPPRRRLRRLRRPAPCPRIARLRAPSAGDADPPARGDFAQHHPHSADDAAPCGSCPADRTAPLRPAGRRQPNGTPRQPGRRGTDQRASSASIAAIRSAVRGWLMSQAAGPGPAPPASRSSLAKRLFCGSVPIPAFTRRAAA